jgi:hypothetical protein
MAAGRPAENPVAPGGAFQLPISERWEFVAEGVLETPLSASGPSSFSTTGAFLKWVVKPGPLQDQTGLSIATEFGPLLPEVNGDRGTGFSWGALCRNVGTGALSILRLRPI